MKALMFVLNDADLLQPVLEELGRAGIKGCTIFESSGMGRELSKKPDVFGLMFGSLRNILTPDLKTTRTLLFALQDDKVELVVQTIESVVGDLNNPATGILFTMPIDMVKGLKL